MAVEMHPPLHRGVVSVGDDLVKEFEARGFTRVAPKPEPKPAPKKSSSK